MKTLIVVAFLAAIVWNLFAALFYMLRDDAGSSRMVRALTRRIALSVALTLLIVAGVASGVLQPHGVTG